jgi:aminoglycoside 2''-phosphotransferase
MKVWALHGTMRRSAMEHQDGGRADGDVRLTAYLRRIAEVCPDAALHPARLVPAGEGQYNDVVVAGERLVFRFPRFADGVASLLRVARLLALVRQHVTLTTPDPRYVVAEPPEAGHAFLGYPLIPGQPLRFDTLESLARRHDTSTLSSMAVQLATALRQLHRVPAGEVETVLPGELANYRPLAEWEDLYARIERLLFPHMRSDARVAVAALFEGFLSDPTHHGIEPVLIHGDYGTGNWLYDPTTHRITGVMDFDSCGPGDPAIDIAAGAQGPPAFVEQFSATYGVTDELATRARFYRATYQLQEALYGAEHDDPAAFAAIAAYQ